MARDWIRPQRASDCWSGKQRLFQIIIIIIISPPCCCVDDTWAQAEVGPVTSCTGFVEGSSRTGGMGSACIKVTKYFLFLFNLIFFILGAVILGFGVWILADKSSFISVLQTSSSSLRMGAYVFIGVGAVTMLMGFLGCIGAVNEVRCLLGLYFAFLLLILIAQVTAGALFYFNMGKLKQEMGGIVTELIRDYNSSREDSLQDAWDYVQAQVKCCGWVSFYNWTHNAELMNRPEVTYPCSCEVKGEEDNSLSVRKGFCEAPGNRTQSGNHPEDWPVYQEGCMEKVQAWLQENLGIILGVGVGVAIIELLGMVLSICLCRHVHSEDYSKVPKY
ncbi:CD82 antigen isoform X3 [Pan troglodytes]|uniref:CD82 antigen isoform X3 n=1 Tax=Pan troglodytes TaxID=9598 RepID=UPI003013861D